MPSGVRATRPGHDDRILGVHQHFRGFFDGAVIAGGRRGQRQLGNLQACRDRPPESALPAARRRRRSPPAPWAASSRSCKRARRIRRSRPATPASRPTWCSREPSKRRPARCAPIRHRCVSMRHPGCCRAKVDRHAIGVSVVNGHGCVLQSHRAVRHHHHRLAFDLGVAVGHGDRRFFVAAGEQLGHLVAAVIDAAIRGCRGRLEPGLAATYSKPSVLMTSTMKSEPGRSVVQTSTRGGGGVVSAAVCLAPGSGLGVAGR